MDLITPAFGLIFWQTLIFLVVLFVLGKFAWKPILGAVKTRDESIVKALKAAEKARHEMENLQVENEKLIAKARKERSKILKEAARLSEEIRRKAKDDASKIGDKMIEEARVSIKSEKEDALREIRDQVAELSLMITEKLLKKNLEDDKSQLDLIKTYMKDLNLN
jgi:F-type H+-transporting ATPase subunit b